AVAQHVAELAIDVDEAAVDADVTDADRRELDRARVALLALAQPPHRLGLHVVVADLHAEAVDDLQEPLVRLGNGALADGEDPDGLAVPQHRDEKRVLPTGPLRDVLALHAVSGAEIRDPQRLGGLPDRADETEPGLERRALGF